MLLVGEIHDCLYVFDCPGQTYLNHITSIFCLQYIHTWAVHKETELFF